jgi:hypothetical protein
MRKIRLLTLGVAAMLMMFGQAYTSTGRAASVLERAIKSTQRLPSGRPVPPISGGVESSFQQPSGPQLKGPLHVAPLAPSGSSGCPNVYSASGFPNNVRANQDCGLRTQAEEWVRVNPTDANNVVVTQNDRRTGFNEMGVSWSIDNAAHFGDYGSPIEFAICGGTAGPHDGLSDPAHEFDTAGNMYYTGIGFERFSSFPNGENGIYVWKSNAVHKGSFLHSPSPGPFQEFNSSPAVVTEECDPATPIFNDKEFMAIDSHAGSPFVNNIYITWTRFDSHCGGSGQGFCESPIFFSRSTDAGVTWSPIKEISGNNSSICQFGNFFDPTKDPADCNFDQGSDPIVGPDGTIYVAFNNCNTPTLVCQQLFVKSSDGGNTWTQPVKVADDFATQPYNLVAPFDPATGCPFFRQCLSPNGYRLTDFPSIGIDDASGKLAVFWSDFRNGGPCATDSGTGLPVEPCANHNNDVFVSMSSNGGGSWGPTKLVSKGSSGQSQPAAQWQNWGDVADGSGVFFVAYYDRQNGGCEGSGCNDITLAKSTNNGNSWTYRRITTASMPNLTPSNNPFEQGFLGDYMSIQATNNKVYMAWADTRGLGGTVDEDIYYATVSQ